MLSKYNKISKASTLWKASLCIPYKKTFSLSYDFRPILEQFLFMTFNINIGKSLDLWFFRNWKYRNSKIRWSFGSNFSPKPKVMNSYQKDFERTSLQLWLSWLTCSTMDIERMVRMNITTIALQSPKENGAKKIQKRMVHTVSSGTTILRTDCIYGCVKSTSFKRSLVIVKSATTPSTSFDQAWNMRHYCKNE